MNNYTNEQIKQAFYDVQKELNLSDSFMSELEKAARLESAHFKSLEFKYSNCFGMVAVNPNFPYGWSAIKQFCTLYNVDYNDLTTYKVKLNYVCFPDLYTGILFFAWFIKTKRNGNISAWNSLNKDSQNKYRNLYLQIKSRFYA